MCIMDVYASINFLLLKEMWFHLISFYYCFLTLLLHPVRDEPNCITSQPNKQ